VGGFGGDGGDAGEGVAILNAFGSFCFWGMMTLLVRAEKGMWLPPVLLLMIRRMMGMMNFVVMRRPY
jgi:hypothetical protein